MGCCMVTRSAKIKIVSHKSVFAEPVEGEESWHTDEDDSVDNSAAMIDILAKRLGSQWLDNFCIPLGEGSFWGKGIGHESYTEGVLNP